MLETFGPRVLGRDGTLTVRQLGRLVFADPAARAAGGAAASVDPGRGPRAADGLTDCAVFVTTCPPVENHLSADYTCSRGG